MAKATAAGMKLRWEAWWLLWCRRPSTDTTGPCAADRNWRDTSSEFVFRVWLNLKEQEYSLSKNGRIMIKIAACHTPGIRGACVFMLNKREWLHGNLQPLNLTGERKEVTQWQQTSLIPHPVDDHVEQETVSLSIMTTAQQLDPTALELLTCFTASEAYTQHASWCASWVPRQRVYVPRVSPPECPEAQKWVWEACQAETLIHVQMPSGSGRGEVWARWNKKYFLMFNHVSLWCLQLTSAFLVVHHAYRALLDV